MRNPIRWTLLAMSLLLTLLASSGAGAQTGEPLEVNLADADLTFLGEAADDWAGYSVSPAGDVNNDGYDDFLVGAPRVKIEVQPGRFVGAGAAYLVLGRANEEWPASPIDLSQADAQFLGLPTDGMTGRQNYTAGDVNNDGFDDFLISGWTADSGLPQQGKAYLFLGRSEIDWGMAYPVGDANASFLGENAQDFAGYYVSTAGDVNNDDYDDFLITSTHYDISNTETISGTGKVYLILGRETPDWGLDYSLANADASFIGEEEEDRIGRSATGVGDVNGDGYDDFLIASISNDEGGNDAGQSYLFLGRAAGGAPDYDPDRPWWGTGYSVAGADASFIGEAEGDESGRRVAGAGDVNGDGYDDFLIGASKHDYVAPDVGKTYLILGKPSANWGMDFPLAQANAGFIGESAHDQAGRRVSGAGDVNGDGFHDFLIGAPHSNRAGERAGSAYLMYGRPNAAAWSSNFSLRRADIVYVGEAELDVAGYDVAAAGDVDGNGFDDTLIGAYGSRVETESPGKAHLILMHYETFFLPLVVSP
jgi:hypothetical protein